MAAGTGADEEAAELMTAARAEQDCVKELDAERKRRRSSSCKAGRATSTRQVDLAAGPLPRRGAARRAGAGEAWSTRAEIEAADWSLTPGRYVGVAPAEVDEDFDFEQTLRDIHIELTGLNEEAVELAARIQENFEELGV